MAEKVTLELPEAVTLQAREAAQLTGRTIEVVLQDWIKRGAAEETASSFAADVEYPVYTPYGNEGAAGVLYQDLKAAEV